MRRSLATFALGFVAWLESVSATPILRTVDELLSLQPEQARQAIPVKMRGVVTTPSGWKNSFFFADATAGISVNQAGEGTGVHSGDMVEIEGVSEAGGFAPSIEAKSVRIVGRASLPKARLLALTQLQGGAFDSQWIEIRGVVREARVVPMWSREFVSLLVDTGDGQLTAQFFEYSGDPQRLIDAVVEIRGVCGTIFNDRRQFVGVRLFVPEQASMRIVAAGDRDPFQSPPRPLDAVFNFGRNVSINRRIVVRGTVTYHAAGQSLYIQDHGYGLLVYSSRAKEPLPIGSKVEVAGYAAKGPYSPVLESAVVRVVGDGGPLHPVQLEAADVVRQRKLFVEAPNDAQLARLRGRLIEWTDTPREQVLLFGKDAVVFTAHLRKEGGPAKKLAIGSIVDVTGVVAANAGRNGEPVSFQLLLRSPGDLQVVSRPSWWSVEHALWMSAATALVVLLALAAVQSLRERVKRQRSALRQSAQTFQETLASLPLLALVLDNEGRITFANQLLLDLVGHSSTEVAGLNWREAFVVDSSIDALEENENYIRAADGGRRLIAWFHTAILDSAGQPSGTAWIGEDISEQRRIEENLKTAARDAAAASGAKSEFLASMSHEIRTPMNGVIGMASLLLDMELPAEAREYASVIRSSGDALLTIINDILDFSKIESGKLELEAVPFRLDHCLEAALGVLASRASEKGLDLAYWIDEDVPPAILGDATRLRQILVNLVGNGVKFTEAGEVMVSVSARRREGSEYEIHFRVRDTGIGIPEDKIGRLFQFFSQVDRSTTRQYGGTGLGLAISKKLAELMGGRIWVESTEGEGSTFQFVIVAGAAAGADAPQVVPPALAGKRILVVDDNATTRQILVKHLERRGAEAVASASGADALAIAREALDLAVIDQEMPEIDGFTLAKQLRQIPGRRSLPLVLLASTAQAASDGGRHLFAAVHAKPVKPERLCQLIGEVLGGPVRQEHQTRSEFDAELAGRIPLKILVAEDNTVNQRLALRMLQKMGYQADIVENGLEVLDALQRERYEVILMDVQMPRMDGLETTRHIRTRGVEGPRIIAMTANAIHGDREKCLEAGMDDYVSKPIQIAHLQAALARCEKSPVPQK